MRGLTNEQKEYVNVHYNEMTDSSMAEHLGVKVGAIHFYRFRSGMRKDPAFVERTRRMHRNGFKKGQRAYNKGMKLADYYPPESLEKIRRTSFKKGNVPKSHREVGSVIERKDGKWIKYREGHGNYNTMPLWRWNWIQAHGEIPEGMYVECIDGDYCNCEIDNLRLVSKKELMLRHSENNYPVEIRNMFYAIKKAERELNKHINK